MTSGRFYVCLTLLGFCASACQSGTPEGGASPAGQKVVFATSGSLSVYTRIFEKFTEKHGVPVEVVRKPPEMVAEIVASEAAARRSSIDLIHITARTLSALYRDGYIRDFMPEEAGVYPDSFKYGEWGVAVRQNYCSVIYNVELLGPEDLDALISLEDLVDPRWKGRIAIEYPERGAGSGFAFLHTLYKMKRIDRNFLEALYWNRPVYGRSATPITTQLVAGDFAAYLNGEIGLTEQFRAKGAPIDWLRQDMVFSVPIPVGMNADSPHPYQAELAYAYLLTREAQELLAELGEGPTHPSVLTKWWPPDYDPEIVVEIPPSADEAQAFTETLIQIFHR